MSHLRALLVLYRDVSVDTLRAMRRSGWSLVLLALVQASWTFLAVPLAGVGGLHILLGLAEALLVGAYLSVLPSSVSGTGRVRWADVLSAPGHLFWETMSVLFAFWLPSLVLQLAAPSLVPIALVIATVLFNPVPELIYQGRSTSFALLGDAAGFVQQNWPEWFVGQLIPLVAGALLLAMTGQGLGLAMLPTLVSLFGPFFGFATGGLTGLTLFGASGIATFAASLVLIHGVMVYRGRLFDALSRSNRRGRAWAAMRNGSR